MPWGLNQMSHVAYGSFINQRAFIRPATPWQSRLNAGPEKILELSTHPDNDPGTKPTRKTVDP